MMIPPCNKEFSASGTPTQPAFGGSTCLTLIPLTLLLSYSTHSIACSSHSCFGQSHLVDLFGNHRERRQGNTDRALTPFSQGVMEGREGWDGRQLRLVYSLGATHWVALWIYDTEFEFCFLTCFATDCGCPAMEPSAFWKGMRALHMHIEGPTACWSMVRAFLFRES